MARVIESIAGYSSSHALRAVLCMTPRFCLVVIICYFIKSIEMTLINLTKLILMMLCSVIFVFFCDRFFIDKR